MGFGLMLLVLVVVFIVMQVKVLMIVMVVVIFIILQCLFYIVCIGFMLVQVILLLVFWVVKNGIKSVVIFVFDYGLGLDVEKVFVKIFFEVGGKVMESVCVFLCNLDYVFFLQWVKDVKLQVLFVFVFFGEGVVVLKQFIEWGLVVVGI